MHELVAGDDVAGLHGALFAIETGNKAAGLAHQKDTGGEIPRRENALPIGVEAAGRHVSKIERGRAEAPQARDLVLDRAHLAAEQGEIAASVMRQRAAYHRLDEALARRDADAPVVEERARA